MTPDKFAKRLDFLAYQVGSNAESLLTQTALTVHSTIVLVTPVDTGRAKGNWLIEFGAPAEGTVDDPAEFGAGPALKKAKEKLSSGDQSSSWWRPQRDVHITNNLPYINPLNEGHSDQAPVGFVEEAVAAGIKVVQGAKLLDPSGRTVGVGRNK